MSNEELEQLNLNYSQNLKHSAGGRAYEPSASDLITFRAWYNGKMTEKQAAGVMGVSRSTVLMRFARIAKLQK